MRLIGRLPFQGRHGTLALIRLCHDLESPRDVRHARSRLRHAVVMNGLRHVAPLPAGALAVLGWATLARRLSVPFAPFAGAAAALTGLLEMAGVLAAYAQARIHLTLARQLRTRPRPTPQPGGAEGNGLRLATEATVITMRRDRVATRTLVGAAVCLLPPGVAIDVLVLVGSWTP